MEPITIIGLVATCGQIVRYTIGAITGLDELRARLSTVEVDVNALRAEIELIRAAVEELRVWLNTNPPREREESVRSLRRSLDACEDVLSLLHNETERDRTRIEKDLEKGGKISFRSRLMHIYRQDRINVYRQNLAYQLDALNFHLGTIQLPTQRARLERVRGEEGRRIIDRAWDAASSLCPSDSRSVLSSPSESRISVIWSEAYAPSDLTPLTEPDSLTEVNLAHLNNNADISNKGMTERTRPMHSSHHSSTSGSNSTERPYRQRANQSNNRDNRSRRVSRRAEVRDSLDSKSTNGPGQLKLRKRREGAEQSGSRLAGLRNNREHSERDSRRVELPAGRDNRRRAGSTRSSLHAKDLNFAAKDDDDNNDAGSMLSVVQSTISSLENVQNQDAESTPGSRIGQRVTGILNRLRQLAAIIRRTRDAGSVEELTALRDMTMQIQQEVEALLGRRQPEDLISVVKSGDVADVERVIRTRPGIDIDIRNELGLTPLHIAVLRSNLAVVQVLIHHGSSLDTRDNSGNSALQALCSSRSSANVVMLSCLLDAGANPNAMNGQSTVLHGAISQDRLEYVDHLLLNGSNINATSGCYNWTPLHYCCSRSSASKAKLTQRLVNGGADIQALTNHNFRPLDYALKSLRSDEKKLCDLTVGDGLLTSALHRPCRRYRASVEAIYILANRLPNIVLNASSTNCVRMTFLFSEFLDFSRMPIQRARSRLRDRFVEVLLEPDEGLYRRIRQFSDR